MRGTNQSPRAESKSHKKLRKTVFLKIKRGTRTESKKKQNKLLKKELTIARRPTESNGARARPG